MTQRINERMMDQGMGTLLNAYSQNPELKTTPRHSFLKAATLCSSSVVEQKNTGLKSYK